MFCCRVYYRYAEGLNMDENKTNQIETIIGGIVFAHYPGKTRCIGIN
jgi:hypothetical protein